MIIYSFPPEWIAGDTHPNGVPYNTVLSANDKKMIAQLYGAPSRAAASGQQASSTTDVQTLPVFYPYKGVCSLYIYTCIKLHTMAKVIAILLL